MRGISLYEDPPVLISSHCLNEALRVLDGPEYFHSSVFQKKRPFALGRI